MYIPRKIESRLIYLSEHFPVVIVGGARQTGKTTLVKRLIAENVGARYATLDYPRLRDLAKNDPELFLQSYPPPVVIDEIQYAPELLPYIKTRVDENRTPGQYFLTGSQMFRVMEGVSESLAGRAGILSIYGLSRAEIKGKPEKPFLPTVGPAAESGFVARSSETVVDVFDQIYRGSMPQMIVDSELAPEAYYGGYVQTYLERDVRALLEIKNESTFLKFLGCAAARTGQELNLSDLGRDVGINSNTAERWLSLLVTSGIVFLLQPYSRNTVKRIVKRPKAYFMDCGLACYLSLWNNPRALENSAAAGAFFETYVISELVKEYCNAGLDVRSRFFYYRDRNGAEIDLIIYENGVLYPVEIKKSGEPQKDAIKNFPVLDGFPEKRGPGAVICLSPFRYPFDADNSAVPIGEI